MDSSAAASAPATVPLRASSVASPIPGSAGNANAAKDSAAPKASPSKKAKPGGSATRPTNDTAGAKPAATSSPAPTRRPASESPPPRKEPTVRVAWRLNHPKVSYDQITALRCVGEAWDVQTDLRIRVSEGVLDEICLEMPGPWSGPYKIVPASPARTVAPTGGALRELVIRPRLAVDGEWRLSISGPLNIAAGERVAAPEIVLRDAKPGKRFLVLPTQAQLQPIAWETQGLREAPLPADFTPPLVGREALVSYEVGGEPCRAVLKTLERASRAVQVHLADVSLAWLADGSCSGVAAFDLGPSELAQCQLRLPEGLRPLQVTACGVLSPPSHVDANLWQISLNSNGLPQRIEVLFEGLLSGRVRVGPVDLQPPALEGLPVRQTLWTVSGPPSMEADRPAAVRAVDQLEQEWTRLQNVTALIEQGADLSGKEPEEILRWYRTAVHRWAALRHEVERLLQASRSDMAQNVQSELPSMDRKQWRIANRLGASQVLAQEFAETSAADSSPRLWLGTVEQRPAIMRCIAPGAGTPLLLNYRVVEVRRLSWDLWTAAIALTLTALAAFAWRLGLLRVLLHWPLVAGLFVGAAWWLWLEPSLLGLALIAVSLLYLVRSAWRRYRHPHSLIVPLDPSSM